MPRTKPAKKTTAKKQATACGWCGTEQKLDSNGNIEPHKMKPTDTSTCPGTGHPPL